jgi:hypothetical protein
VAIETLEIRQVGVGVEQTLLQANEFDNIGALSSGEE